MNMFIHDFISQDIEEFRKLCIQYNVSALYVFGSAARKDFDLQRSDIDMLVEINESDPLEKGEKLLGLWDALEGYFKRKVDLLTETSLKNPLLKKRIETTKELIYDGRSTEVIVRH